MSLQVEQDLLLVHALARALHHCIIIIYDNKEKAGKSEQIIRFNSESTKPPLIFGLTFFYNKNLEFNIDSLNPLTTNAKSYSDLPEIFTTDFLHFLENKMFLHEFFLLQGLPRY